MPDTPDPRATLELLIDRANYIEQCATSDGLSPATCFSTVLILRNAIANLRRLAEVEAERREAHVFLTGKGGEISWCMAHPNGEPDTELGKAAKAVCIDRDAGWEAAEKLAGQLASQREILSKVLVNCHSAFAGDSVRGPKPFVDLIESLVKASKPAITEALAAYTAARAARNPNPEGRT